MKENQKMKLVYKYENNCDKQLKEGMIVEGTIKSIQQYGAFIEIENGTVGLLHIQDISVARIKTPAERFKIGQKVKVVVKSIDSENNRMQTYLMKAILLLE